MASNDFSGVTAAFNAASYTAGQTMTVTVSGQNRHTSDPATTQEVVTFTASVQAAGGATSTITGGPTTVTRTTPGGVTLEDVRIVSVTDGANRVYTVATDGRTATAIA